MRKMSVVLMLGCVFVCGCPLTPPPGPPAAAVLEGNWSVIPEDPGEFEGWEYEARFDSNGDLVELSGVRPEDGATARLTIDDATTELDGSDVVITVPDLTGARVFEGTLSDDQNTMTGSVTDQIDLGDLEASLPRGELTFERIITDPCDDVDCDDGQSCVDGECVADDPCDGVICDDGDACTIGACVFNEEGGAGCVFTNVLCEEDETCVDGECVPDIVDPCDGVTCDDGETCVDGDCVPDIVDPCDGVTCETGETCVDGVCVPDMVDPCDGVTCGTCEECVEGTCVPLGGDAPAGEAFYSSNGCGDCHGPNGNDGFAPDITMADCALLFDKMSGNVSHVGGTVDGVTEQDAADLQAWLSSLGQ